ncbi:MAG: phosphopantetheine-binding protein [Pseudomonadota bacterium]
MEDIVKDTGRLCEFLKKMIIETLKLEDITVADIENDEPLFREGLGLDSIDALELVVAIEKLFRIIIEDEDVGKKAFASVRALAAFVQEGYRPAPAQVKVNSS